MTNSKIVTLSGNRKAVVGLSWHAITSSTNDGKELAELCDKHDAKFGVVLKNGDASIAGLADSAVTGPAAAAWVAQASKGESMVMLETLPDGKVWLCAVRNSMPQPGFDVVIDTQSVVDHLAKLSEIAKFKLVSRNFEDMDEELDFGTLVDGFKPLYVHQLSGVSNVTKLAILGATTLISALIGGYYLYQDHIQTRSQNNLRQLELTRIENEQREAEAKRQAALAAAEAIVATRVTTTPGPTSAVSSWLSSFDQIPTSVAGWSMSKVQCSATECKITWQRKDGGTTAEFMARAVSSGWKVVSQDMSTMVTLSSAQAESRSGRPQEVPAADGAVAELATTLQRLTEIGITGQMKPAEPVGEAPGTTGTPAAGNAPPGAAPSAPASPWKIGAISLSGRTLYEPREVVSFIDRTHISINTFEINFDNKSWTMEGSYAVQ